MRLVGVVSDGAILEEQKVNGSLRAKEKSWLVLIADCNWLSQSDWEEKQLRESLERILGNAKKQKKISQRYLLKVKTDRGRDVFRMS